MNESLDLLIVSLFLVFCPYFVCRARLAFHFVFEYAKWFHLLFSTSRAYCNFCNTNFPNFFFVFSQFDAGNYTIFIDNRKIYECGSTNTFSLLLQIVKKIILTSYLSLFNTVTPIYIPLLETGVYASTLLYN